jgi:amino acid adenylation domain-containing protein
VIVDAVVSISDRISSWAAAGPGRLAVTDGTAHLTYADLDRRSGQLAAHLRDSGAGPERCVGLFLERSADFVVAALAVLRSGAAYLPMDPSTPADRAAFILTDAGAPLLVTHRNKAAELPPGPWRTIEMDGAAAEALAARSAPGADLKAEAEGLAYVIYTSGSSGRPKGVEITHANLANLLDWHQRTFGITPQDRIGQTAGLGFDPAGWEIWTTLAAGASLHIADEMTRRSADALLAWIVAQKLTGCLAPTVLTEQLLQAKWPRETALRTLHTGGDLLHRRPAPGLPFDLVNHYGPTECTVIATSGWVRPEASFQGPPSIGRPIANTSAFILDDQLRAVPPGEPGELCLAGAHVGRGYRNHPRMTADRFVMYQPDGGAALRVYRTGDRARLLENGEISFLGRIDDQVKVRGYRIEPGEIVACLDRHPGVQASAVAPRYDTFNGSRNGGPVLVGYVVPARAARLTALGLREFLARQLPDYMVPAYFVSLTALPLTVNGKLDKSALPVPTPGNLLLVREGPDEVAPASCQCAATEFEHRIGDMVASLMGRHSIDREDDFFMVGGHSMLGAQLVTRIRESFGVKLTLRQLFGASTVAALSAEVARLVQAASTPALPAREKAHTSAAKSKSAE